MTTVVGSGALSFEVAEGWGSLPDGMSLKETPDVAVDSQDRVYAFSRGDHGVVVFDREGNFLKAWGAEVFGNAHGICIGPDDAVYCVDNGDHTVRKFSTDGELLMTLGTADKPSPRFSGDSFNLPDRSGGFQQDGRPAHLRRLRQRQDSQVQRRRRAHHVMGAPRA